ncbi:MAG: HlyD family type I secretion periplasmic adaptor subunit [Pseudomonadota bacterium]
MLATRSAIRRHVILALLLVVLMGGTATAWSIYAPLEGAVVAQGLLVVEGNTKKVQHPTGGIVGALLVEEGQRVEAGAVVLRLDDTQTRASLGIVLNELTSLRARHARLAAEQAGKSEPTIPAELTEHAQRDPSVAQVLDGERALMEMRRRSRGGQEEQLHSRVRQLRDEITGLDEQRQSLREQLVISKAEYQDLSSLSRKGLVQRPRMSALEREILRSQGQIGELTAKIAQTEGRIGETELQISQLDHGLLTEVSTELREVETRIRELEERRLAAEDSLARVEVRAPISGRVHQLAVHTVGGVVNASEPLMLVVPDAAELVVEARIDPADIDQLQVGQSTRVRLAAFNRQTTPELEATLFRVSADLSKDPATNGLYYVAGIRLPPSELAKLDGLKLIPGMPAEVYIKTGERTLASYLIKPLQDQMQRALREM